MNSSSACAGCGLAPRPPATNTWKPASIGAVVERAGGGDHADVVEHRLAAVGGAAGEVDLELAGQALGVRVVQEVRKVASAHGLMSSTSYGQAPARWQPMTLRTVSPHASRVVRPTDASQAQDLGDLLELDEVELHVLAGREVAPAPASRSSAM